MITIEKADNGYIIGGNTIKRVEPTIEKTLTYLLQHFEGRAEQFSGDMYGKITIRRCKCGDKEGCSQCSKADAA